MYLLQQNLTCIQRQKSEVLAATSSYYDSFLDVIEFRVNLCSFFFPFFFLGQTIFFNEQQTKINNHAFYKTAYGNLAFLSHFMAAYPLLTLSKYIYIQSGLFCHRKVDFILNIEDSWVSDVW